jgi:2-keto-3-deoxy-L-rhamnonate aldolase RhmA
MGSRLVLALTLGAVLVPEASSQQRLNPLVELLEQRQPVFGLYAPSNRRPAGGRSGAPSAATAAQPTPPASPASPAAQKTPDELALEALAHKTTDYIFDGSMEGNFDRGYESFTAFAAGMHRGGVLTRTPAPRLSHPLVVKMTKLGLDAELNRQRISRQLNLGVSVIVFVGVESADEVRQGIGMMRFAAAGGSRPDDVGGAPAYWGMSASEYRERADLWPLNPKGELVNWTIVESRAGLARVREIAAVPGIGVLFPGAGTLRGLFTTTDGSGQRQFDAAGWEAAIQQVLAACKEFRVACGYPATENDIEERMRQGFSVFVINWGEAGFRAIDKGRALSKR